MRGGLVSLVLRLLVVCGPCVPPLWWCGGMRGGLVSFVLGVGGENEGGRGVCEVVVGVWFLCPPLWFLLGGSGVS